MLTKDDKVFLTTLIQESIQTEVPKIVKDEIKEVKADIKDLKGDVTGLKEDVTGLKEDNVSIKQSIKKLEEGVRANTGSLQILVDYIGYEAEKINPLQKLGDNHERRLNDHDRTFENHSFKLMGLDKNQNQLNERVSHLEGKVA